jgi:predicted nucleotidyltransferase
MTAQPDLVTHLTAPIAEWCQHQPVRLCILFGSQATGKAHAASDVDLAVWPTQTLSTAQKLSWVNQLSDLLNCEVNLLVVSPDLDPVLGFELVRDGRLIFEATPGNWLHQRAQLWHAYNDSLPFRRAARARLDEFVAVQRGP